MLKTSVSTTHAPERFQLWVTSILQPLQALGTDTHMAQEASRVFRGGGEGLQYGQVVQSTPLGSYQTYSYGTNGLSPFSQFGGGQVQGNAYGGQFGGGAFGLSQPSGFIFPVSVCFVF